MYEKQEDFEMACKAFTLMTQVERYAVLEEFASLRYPSIVDRFFEGVHRVITRAATRREAAEVEP